MALSDIRDVPTSAANWASLDALEIALDESLGMRRDPLATLDRILSADPGFVLGHCLRAELQLLTTERSLVAEAAHSVEMAEALTGAANPREKGHIAAIRAWLGGDLEKAVDCWEDVLLDHLRDLQALLPRI